jgi:hypothetical protein
MQIAAILGTFALLVTANAAQADDLTCEGLAAVMASAPTFKPYRGKAFGTDPNGTGDWFATYNPDGAHCTVDITHNQGDAPDEFQCQWDFKTRASYDTEITKLSKLLHNCPQWHIARTVASASQNHQLQTDGDTYEFNVMWNYDPSSEDNIQLEIYRGVDRRASDKYMDENGF